MSESTGLIITDDHQKTISNFQKLPVSFCGEIVEWQAPLDILSQGRSSSCVGHGTYAAAQLSNYVVTKETSPRFSPWFAYLKAQESSGFLGRDNGASVRGGIEGATKFGCCLESLCQRPSSYNTYIASEALKDAAEHKHFGEPVDLRDFEPMTQWVSDFRAVLIGTKWMGSQSGLGPPGVEDLQAYNGSFLGYHCRCIIGIKKIGGEFAAVCQNSHGTGWGLNGISYITQRLWERFKQDPNFCAYGFTKIGERVPKRADLSQYSFILGDTPSIG